MSQHQTPDSQPPGMASIDVTVDEPTAVPPPSRRAFLSLIGAGLGAAMAAPSIATARRAGVGADANGGVLIVKVLTPEATAIVTAVVMAGCRSAGLIDSAEYSTCRHSPTQAASCVQH